MSAAADEIATKLIALGVGTALATDVFIDKLPDQTEDDDTLFVCVSNSGGGPPGHVMGSATIYIERPNFQIRVRGDRYDSETPGTAAQTAFEGLAQVIATTLTGSDTSAFYHWIRPLQSPFILERDAQDRVVWAFNVAVEKGLSS